MLLHVMSRRDSGATVWTTLRTIETDDPNRVIMERRHVTETNGALGWQKYQVKVDA